MDNKFNQDLASENVSPNVFVYKYSGLFGDEILGMKGKDSPQSHTFAGIALDANVVVGKS